MEMTACQLLEIHEQSQIAEARRAVVAEANGAGLDEHRASDAAIVATELGTNLLKHGGGGVLLVQPGRRGGVGLWSLDRGPGMANLARARQDGHSSAGSPGTGLGAISRLSDEMDVYSQPGHGTVVYARVASPGSAGAAGRGGFESDAVCVAVRGETVCGDAFAIDDGSRGCLVMIADGLGHGPLAGEASSAAVAVFRKNAGAELPDIITAIHDALRSTRGAAVAVALVHSHQGVVRYCGIGNISGVLLGGSTRRMVSQNGTAGLTCPRVTEFTYPWARGDTLVMHSDGLLTKWDLERYPGLIARHPAVIAGVLFRDLARGRDDATILVAREAGR